MSLYKVCKSKYFYGVVILPKRNKILKFNNVMNSDKIPYIVCTYIESLIRKTDSYANNPEKSSKMKIGEYILYGYSMPTILGFDHTENKDTLYRGKDCMKNFCESLREYTKNITDFKEENVTCNKRRIKITPR